MEPEFALPARFAGGPVIAGVYVPRAGRNVPLWVVAAASSPDLFHVGSLREDGESTSSRYDISPFEHALEVMCARAGVLHAARR